jgi:hypothetical protein
MDVTTSKVRSALDELSDADYQRRVWTGRDPRGEMASFEECVAELFDDSSLDLAFEKGEVVFSPDVDGRLLSLGRLLAEIDTDRDPRALVEDPAMEHVRRAAAEILRDLDA